MLPLELLDEEEIENELVLGIELETQDISKLQKLVEEFKSVISSMKKGLIANSELDEKDRNHLESEVEFLEMLLQKYSNKYEKAKLERTKINAFNTALKTFKRKYSERQTDQQNRHNAFSEEKKILAENIANLIKTRNSLTPYECLIEETEVEPEVNPVDAFLFVSKIAIEKIDNAYFEEILKGSLKKGNRIQVEEITREDLRKMISRYPTEIDDPLEALKFKIKTRLDADFKPIKAITENGKDVYTDLSAGFNSRIYFKLLSGEEKNKGIWARILLAIIPAILLLFSGKVKAFFVFEMLFLAGCLLQYYLLGKLSGFFNFLVLATAGILSQFIPGLMMGYYTVTTTTVSEFVAAMERMHMPKQIVIPLSVMFRFFPTVGEEASSISDAMRMRGISFGGNHPGKMLEYRLIPLMTCSVKIGDGTSFKPRCKNGSL